MLLRVCSPGPSARYRAAVSDTELVYGAMPAYTVAGTELVYGATQALVQLVLNVHGGQVTAYARSGTETGTWCFYHDAAYGTAMSYGMCGTEKEYE
eukprot:1993750-Rhodomonas_salina.1